MPRGARLKGGGGAVGAHPAFSSSLCQARGTRCLGGEREGGGNGPREAVPVVLPKAPPGEIVCFPLGQPQSPPELLRLPSTPRPALCPRRTSACCSPRHRWICLKGSAELRFPAHCHDGGGHADLRRAEGGGGVERWGGGEVGPAFPGARRVAPRHKAPPPSPFRKPEGGQPGIHQTDLFLAGGAVLRGRGRLGEGEPREGREKLRAWSPCPVPGRLGFFRGDVFSPPAQRAPCPSSSQSGAPRGSASEGNQSSHRVDGPKYGH